MSFNNGCPDQIIQRKPTIPSGSCSGGGFLNRINLFPNPTEDIINVLVKEVRNKNIEFRFLDSVTGQLLLSKKVLSKKDEINERINLPKSTHKIIFLEVREDGVVIETKKILLK